MIFFYAFRFVFFFKPIFTIWSLNKTRKVLVKIKQKNLLFLNLKKLKHFILKIYLSSDELNFLLQFRNFSQKKEKKILILYHFLFLVLVIFKRKFRYRQLKFSARNNFGLAYQTLLLHNLIF